MTLLEASSEDRRGLGGVYESTASSPWVLAPLSESRSWRYVLPVGLTEDVREIVIEPMAASDAVLRRHLAAIERVEIAKRRLAEVKARYAKAEREFNEALASYADAAMRRATVEEVDPGVWFASVPGIQGAYADADDAETALRDLRAAVISWVAIRLEKGVGVPRLADDAEAARA